MDIKIIDKIVKWIPFKSLRINIKDLLLDDYYKKVNTEKAIVRILFLLENLYENTSMSSLERKNEFTKIFLNNKWDNEESISGGGSTLDATVNVRKSLLNIINKYDIKSILDAPCGDLNWMHLIFDNVDSYIGCDIVEDLININKKKFEHKTNVIFKSLDIVNEPLDKVDLIFSRDCMQHLPTSYVVNFIRNVKRSNSKYLLIGTSNVPNNIRISTLFYDYIHINLEKDPFNFPKALEYIEENEPNKLMGLWKIEDIPEI